MSHYLPFSARFIFLVLHYTLFAEIYLRQIPKGDLPIERHPLSDSLSPNIQANDTSPVDSSIVNAPYKQDRNLHYF